MKIFSKSLYDLEQVKNRYKVGMVDGIELLLGFRMKEDADILSYAKDHFGSVSLESWDYFHDGAGLDLMSGREDVRETSRRFVDRMMEITLKYGLFPFSMHLVSGSVPFRPGESVDIILEKKEDNLLRLKEYLERTYGPRMDHFCFENCQILDYMGKDCITVGNAGKIFEDTIAMNGRACFDIAHYAINFLLCHEANGKVIRVKGKVYPDRIPDELTREARRYEREALNDYLADLIARAPWKSIQRFHVCNICGIDPEDCEGTLEGPIDLRRMFRLMREFHPEAVIVPEVKEADYLNPVNQRVILDMAREGEKNV